MEIPERDRLARIEAERKNPHLVNWRVPVNREGIPAFETAPDPRPPRLQIHGVQKGGE